MDVLLPATKCKYSLSELYDAPQDQRQLVFYVLIYGSIFLHNV
jgi:hypothetical protein